MIISAIEKIKNFFIYIYLKEKWKKLNKDNHTELIGLKNWDRIHVGKGTYGKIQVSDFSPRTGKSKLIIGNYCSIGGNVSFLLGGGHHLNRISTYPFLNKLYGKEESLGKGNIEIEDDVWIGNEVTIMSGVKIGKGAVIGTKALVTKDIPAYAIAVGVPARVIRYRFDDEEISLLKKIDFSKITPEIVENNINLFEKKADINMIKALKEILDGKE